MKQFLKQITLFVLLIGLLLMGISRLYLLQLHCDYEMRKNGTIHYKSMPEKISLAAFGTSHSKYAILWETENGRRIFPFAEEAQGLAIDQMVFNAYLDRFSENAVILFSVSPFLLYFDSREDLSNLDSMKRYCNILPMENLPSSKLRFYRLFRALDFDTRVPVAWFCESVGIGLPFSTTSSFIPKNLAETPEAEILASVPAAPADMEAENQKWREAPYSESTLAILNDMLETCQERGFRAVLYTPPYSHYYTDNDAPVYWERVEACIEQIASEFGVPYLDYSRDERFKNTLSYFMDVDHMSLEGSRAFVPILLSDVEQSLSERAMP